METDKLTRFVVAVNQAGWRYILTTDVQLASLLYQPDAAQNETVNFGQQQINLLKLSRATMGKS